MGAETFDHMRHYMRIAGQLMGKDYRIPRDYAGASNIKIVGIGGLGVVGNIIKDLTEGMIYPSSTSRADTSPGKPYHSCFSRY